MIKALLNLLILVYFLSYFIFLLFRVIGTRSPQDIFSFSGFLCLIYLAYFSFSASLIVYKYFFVPKQPSKIFIFFQDKLSKIIYYLDVDFVQKFLRRNFTINKWFYKNMLFFEKYIDFLDYFLYFVFLGPWIVFLICLFFELFTGTTFYLTLYSLSFGFFVRKLLVLLIWLAYHKHCSLKRYVKITYFDCWYHNTFKFFTNNRFFLNSMFFTEPSLANKKMLVFVWNTYSEIFYYHTICGGSKFFFKKRLFLEKFLTDSNKIFFISIFVSLIFVKLAVLWNFDFFLDIFLVLIWLFAWFLFFLKILTFLSSDFSMASYKDLADFKKLEFPDLLDRKRELLETYSFLKDSDLTLFVNRKTPQDFLLQEADPFKQDLTEEESLLWLKILEKYDDFYFDQVDAKRIDLHTHSFDEESYIASFNSKNNSR